MSSRISIKHQASSIMIPYEIHDYTTLFQTNR